MIVQVLGAGMVFAGCTGVGFSAAKSYAKQLHALEQLILALDFMECQLEYRMLPLPELCRSTAEHCSGAVAEAFRILAAELDRQICPDASACMTAALGKAKGLPNGAGTYMRQLGSTLGQFDLTGQLKGLQSVTEGCRQQRDILRTHQQERMKCCRTLGLCAGAALVILLI